MTQTPPLAFLLVLQEIEDVKKLETLPSGDTRGFQKLGEKTFLGLFEGGADKEHQALKLDLGLKGKILWVALRRVEIH